MLDFGHFFTWKFSSGKIVNKQSTVFALSNKTVCLSWLNSASALDTLSLSLTHTHTALSTRTFNILFPFFFSLFPPSLFHNLFLFSAKLSLFPLCVSQRKKDGMHSLKEHNYLQVYWITIQEEKQKIYSFDFSNLKIKLIKCFLGNRQNVNIQLVKKFTSQTFLIKSVLCSCWPCVHASFYAKLEMIYKNIAKCRLGLDVWARSSKNLFCLFYI